MVDKIDVRTSKKLAAISVLLQIMVVYIHAKNDTIYSLQDSAEPFAPILFMFEQTTYNLFSVAVPLFFMISGYLFFRNFSFDELVHKYKSRFHSLLIPYMIWNTLYWFAYAAIKRIPVVSKHLSDAVLTPMNLESWLRDAIVHPADGPLWFVLNLMGSIILAPVIYFAIRNIKAGVVSLIALTIIAFTVNPPHNSLLSTTILFMVGGMLSIHCRGWVERKYGKKTKCVAGITILIILLITNSYDIYSSGGGEYIITFTVLAAAVWVICDTEPLFTLFNYKDYQFWVYCTHSFILESMEKIFLVICGKSVLAAAIDYILMPIVCIALVCMVGAAVSKGAPRTWKALTGNR